MPANSQPRGVSPWFLVAIGAVPVFVVVILIFAVAFRHNQPTLPPAMREASDNNWVNKFQPTPTATVAQTAPHRVEYAASPVPPFHMQPSQAPHAMPP